MNLHRSRLRMLADIVESTRPSNFNMAHPGSCIAGTFFHGNSDWRLEDFAEFFGLSHRMAEDLLYPEDHTGAYDATPAQGAEVLRHLAATGNLDWHRAMQPEAPFIFLILI